MIILALVVVGAAAFFKLGVDRFPSVDLPTVTVRTTLPGASPEEIESVVSQPIEEAVNTVQGISELRSVSGQGSSFVIATFNLERDIDVAAQDVRDRVSGVVRDLPPDVLPPVVASDNDSTPVLTLALTADRPAKLTEMADKIVKVQLERADGVSEVALVGGLNARSTSGRGRPVARPRSRSQPVRRHQGQNAASGGNVTSGSHDRCSAP